MKGFSYLFGLSRSEKQGVSLAYDLAFTSFALLLASYVRLESFSLFLIPPGIYVAGFSVAVAVISLQLFGVYRTVIRFSGVRIGQQIALAAVASTIALISASFLMSSFLPRTVPFIYLIILWCGLALPRYVLRSLYFRIGSAGRTQVAIYGAGSAGRQVLSALNHEGDHSPSLFIDDDKSLDGARIQNLKVHAPSNLSKLIEKYNLKKIILALPSITRERRLEILDMLEPLSVEVLTIPSLSEIMTGNAQIDDIHQIELEDLLGRSSVAPNEALLAQNISGKTIMVSGAGGSIGSELCRQIIQLNPKCLVLFEQNEFALYKTEQEFQKLIHSQGLQIEIIPLLGSVQHYKRLVTVLTKFKVDTIYHAAAYKHVPLVEYNVIEGIRNNIFGTYFMVKAAVHCNTPNFVLVSTDKAVRPTNVMGASKRCAELICQAYADVEDVKTTFAMVRFGNVLGSSGSVVPLFNKQIALGGPVTVTDPEITRYFMTIPEAAQLVIQAGAMAKGGDVFVLDMGEPVKIVDLAEKMIRLSGLTAKTDAQPNGDIEISFTGLRPGEKLYEELLIGDGVEATDHARIMKANEVKIDLADLETFLDGIDQACHEFDVNTIWQCLLEMPLGFNPGKAASDLVNEVHESV